MLATILKIELRKLLLNRSAIIIFLLFLLLGGLSIYLISGFVMEITEGEEVQIDPRQQLAFPHVWSVFSFFLSYSAFLVPAIIIVITCGELTSGIIRQHIIEGLGRGDLITGKVMVILILVVTATILYVIGSLSVGLYFTESPTFDNMISGYTDIFRFALYLAGTCMLALTFSMYIGTTGLTLIAFLGYVIILEPAVVFMLTGTWAEYLPNTSFRELLSFTLLDQVRGYSANYTAATVSTFAWIIVLAGLSYLKIRRKDL